MRSRTQIQKAHCLRRMPATLPLRYRPLAAHRNVVGGEAQQFVDGRDISGEWWTLFHSKPLNDLIERSLKTNPDIKAAQAALTVAQRKHPGTTRLLLSERQRRIFGGTLKDVQVVSPFTAPIRFDLQLVHPTGQRFLRTRRFRTEPKDRRVAESPTGTGTLCPGRNAYHA